MSDFQVDLGDSSFDFLRVVWPAIKPMLGGGKLIPMEGKVDSNLAQLFDLNSGIDCWHFSANGQMRGIASRIQWTDRNWKTFTVRYSRKSGTRTEYDKRIEAIRDFDARGWLYPFLTVQAYICPPRRYGDLIDVAIVKTSDLIDVCTGILESADGFAQAGQINETSNAKFICVNWDWLKANGYQIKTMQRLQQAA